MPHLKLGSTVDCDQPTTNHVRGVPMLLPCHVTVPGELAVQVGQLWRSEPAAAPSDSGPNRTVPSLRHWETGAGDTNTHTHTHDVILLSVMMVASLLH